jgi:hypothetical protein
MTVSRRIPSAAFLGLFGLAVALSACATTTPSSPRERFLAALDSLGYDTTVTDGPRVAISSETERVQGRRIIPRLHVADDAYVAVVNVWPSGVASVIYPESPAHDGFLAGGRTYVMPSMFSGFATMFPPAGAYGQRFVRFSRSSDVHVGARGPGYLVVVASRTPLDLAALDTAGLFDEIELGYDVREMEPSVIAPWIAVLASGGNPAVSIDHARYGGYDGMSVPGSMLASSHTSSRYCGFGYFGALASHSWDFDYNPACNAEALRYEQLRRQVYTPQPGLPRPPVIRRDSTRPPADTLHTPTVRSAEVRAAWSALVRQSESRRSAVVPPAGETVELPRSREGHAMDDARLDRRRRTGDGRAADVYRGERPAARTRREPVTRDDRVERPRAEQAPQRNDPAPRRADPAPQRTDPAPQRADPAPRPQPVETPRGGDPQPRPVPSAGTP